METDGKKGFALLSVKLYFYLLKYAALQLGEAGVQAVRRAGTSLRTPWATCF